MNQTIPLHRQALATVAAALFAVSAYAGTPIETQPKTADLGVGPYLGLQGGAAAAQAGSSKTGVAGLNLGYTFRTDSLLRPSLEYEGYRIRTGRSRTSSSSLPATGSEGLGESFAFSETLHTDASTRVNMVNALVRLDLGRFQPYAGIGLGLATTETSDRGASTETDTVAYRMRGELVTRSTTTTTNLRVPSRTTTRFATQAVAGTDYYVTPRVSLFGEYRFLNLGSDNGSGLRGSFVGAGVRFHF